MKILETERLILRHIELHDAAFLLELMNEPAYHLNIGDRGVRTIEGAEKYMSEKLIAMYAKNGFGLYLVELKINQTPVGINGLIKRDSMPDVDIGFAFLSKHQRLGYAYESCVGVVQHAKNIGLKRIVGLTRPENIPSIKLLEKIGMKFEKMIKLPEIGTEDKLFSLDF